MAINTSLSLRSEHIGNMEFGEKEPLLFPFFIKFISPQTPFPVFTVVISFVMVRKNSKVAVEGEGKEKTEADE